MKAEQCTCKRCDLSNVEDQYELGMVSDPQSDLCLYECRVCSGLFRASVEWSGVARYTIAPATDRDIELARDYLAWSAERSASFRADDAAFVQWVEGGRK